LPVPALLALDLQRPRSLPPRQSTLVFHSKPINATRSSGSLQTAAPSLPEDHAALLPLPKSWTKARASFLRLWSSHAAPAHEQSRPFHPVDGRSFATFLCLIVVLLLTDGVAFRNSSCHIMVQNMVSLRSALVALPAVFWISCSFIFGVCIYTTHSSTDAQNWVAAYLLEWIMSIQHLFVVRCIFEARATPPDQRDTVLRWGSSLAVLLRLVLFATENYLLQCFTWFYVALGLFLFYQAGSAVSAVKMQASPILEEQPRSLPGCLLSCVPFVDRYSPRGHLFEIAAVNAGNGEPEAPGCPVSTNQVTGFSGSPRTRLVATRLVVVFLQLVASDVVLAIGSVSVVTAQVPDFLLASTASIFATLSVRALFFATDEMARWCEILPYTVAAVSALLGAKLLLKRWLQVPTGAFLSALVLVITLSSVGSFLQLWRRPQQKQKHEQHAAAASSSVQKGRVTLAKASEKMRLGLRKTPPAATP